MNWMWRNNYERRVSRKAYNIVLIAAVVMTLLCGLLTYRLLSTSTSDTRLRDVLMEHAIREEDSARVTTSQISRTGGSNTWQLLGQTRQHLYALSELNSLATIFIDAASPLVPDEVLAQALENLTACESRLLEGRYIDDELSQLWTQLSVISASLQESTT